MKYIGYKRVYLKNEPTKYLVSRHGSVYSEITNKRLVPIADKDGYLRVHIYHNGKMKTKRINRLVAKAFIPNPNELPVVDHIDGNIINDYYKNLEWVTNKENTQRAFKMGLIPTQKGRQSKLKGINHPNCSISEDVVVNICKELSKGTRVTPLSKKLNIDRGIIYDIYHKRSWTYISNNYTFTKVKYKYDDKKNEMVELLEKGLKYKEICTLLNIPYDNTTRDILKKLKKNKVQRLSKPHQFDGRK